eukprot:gene1625-1965_t
MEQLADEYRWVGRSAAWFLQTRLEALNVAFLDGTYNYKAFNSRPPAPKEPPKDAAADAECAEGSAEADGASDDAAAAAGGGGGKPPAPLSCRHYNQSDVAKLRHQLMVLPGEVDLLLTCEWPAGLLQGLPAGQNQVEGFKNELGSLVAAELAFTARPRYHIAGKWQRGQNMFYGRTPYSNPDIGAGLRPTSTEVLSSLPEGCGTCPYQPPTPEGPQAGQKRPAYEHDPIGEHCSWRWLPPKRMRGGFQQGGPPFQPWGKPGVVKDSSRSVFAKNLPFEVTYDDLASFFSQAGQVEDIRRGAQPDTGRPNPWCHVQFTEAGAVPAACALNGSTLMGRPITIATSTPLNREGPEALLHQQYQQQRQDAMQQHHHQQPHRRDGRGGHRRPQGERGHHQQQQQQPLLEPGKPVEGCWFCLSSEQVDINLVSSVGEEVYLALDKGPITPHHCLIIPIEHYPSWAAMPQAAAAEAGRQSLVGFERHLKLRSKGGNHAHINTVGISKTAAEEAGEVFKQLAGEAGLQLQEVPAVDGQLDVAALQQLVGDGEYFLGVLPDGSGLAANLVPGQRAPMQLGRQILAQLAGCPDRADWKACTTSSEEEQKAAEDFRDWFKPYDVMAAEQNE